MKIEEFQKIKNEYKKIKDLIQEQSDLIKALGTRINAYDNFSKLSNRLEIINDELFFINNETDIYETLADHTEFERLQCDTDKKLYFFYGYCIKDKNEKSFNQWGEDYVIFVPRNTKFKSFENYYVMLWDLVDSREYILVPLDEYKHFKKDNYVFDINKEINKPFLGNKEYNSVRHNCDNDDNYDEAYKKLRIDLYRNYIHSETEVEAVKKLVKKYNI